jgi:hypothetical protein
MQTNQDSLATGPNTRLTVSIWLQIRPKPEISSKIGIFPLYWQIYTFFSSKQKGIEFWKSVLQISKIRNYGRNSHASCPMEFLTKTRKTGIFPLYCQIYTFFSSKQKPIEFWKWPTRKITKNDKIMGNWTFVDDGMAKSWNSTKFGYSIAKRYKMLTILISGFRSTITQDSPI